MSEAAAQHSSRAAAAGLTAAYCLAVGVIFGVVWFGFGFGQLTNCTNGGTTVPIGDCYRRIGDPLNVGLGAEVVLLALFGVGFYRACRTRPGFKTALVGLLVIAGVSVVVGAVTFRHASPPQ